MTENSVEINKGKSSKPWLISREYRWFSHMSQCQDTVYGLWSSIPWWEWEFLKRINQIVPSCAGAEVSRKKNKGISCLNGKFLRCRSNEALKLGGASANEQVLAEMPMEWRERIHAQLLNQWINESVNHWINEATKQNNESNDLVGQWITESESQVKCTHECLNQWTNESNMDQWMKERMDGWLKDGRMNDWMDGRKSEWELFVERLLSPLSDLFA